jgi:pyruvate/2-oxoglutarate dehydrogenase complex dihydrolipoamide dehydrogenase (E3) component
MPQRRSDDATDRAGPHHDVAVIGGGTAAVSLVRELDGSGLDSIVFEPRRVGGICPYEACVPTKSMLHDAGRDVRWEAAVRRRDQLVHGLDDSAHADALADAGATIVRSAARFVDPGTVSADGRRFTADHVVVATGARAVVPAIDGLEDVSDLVWTSADAMTSDVLPDRLLVLGAGVIGSELAHLFAGFGSSVTVVDRDDPLFPQLSPSVRTIVTERLRDRAATVWPGVRATSLQRHGDRVAVRFDNREERRFDRVLVATGRRPSLDDLGLDAIGLDPGSPLPVGEAGRVACGGSVWAIGDVAGREQYTHAAGHHGAVVADQLAGRGERRFDDVVTAACVFSDPPLFMVGPGFVETASDDDVVWVDDDLDGVVRANTHDAHGALAVAGSRSTRRLVAAHGVGPGFDELVHAVVYAIDGSIPVDRLVQSMLPFPTMGNALQQTLLRLRSEL